VPPIPRLVLPLATLLLPLLAAPSLTRAQEQLLPAVPAEQAPEAEPAPPTIDPEADAADDAAIERRLRAIYDNIEGLGGVAVRVQAGVVALRGEVASNALRAQAIRLARQVEGVVEVDDGVEVTAEIEQRIAPALERIEDAWRGLVRLLPVLLVALAVFAGFVLLARLARRRRSLYRRLAPNPFLAKLLAQLVQGFVLLAGAFLALLLLDATGVLTTLLGAAGIVGLTLGFALRDTVENYIASILLSLRRPFGPEDYVRVGEHEGIVLRTRASSCG
jgi:small conductance mechanosensitive channel